MPVNLREWGALIISVLVVGAFLAALAVAFVSHDATNLTLLIGAVVTQLGNVVGYWIGSSIGSARKDEVLTNLAQGPTPPL